MQWFFAIKNRRKRMICAVENLYSRSPHLAKNDFRQGMSRGEVVRRVTAACVTGGVAWSSGAVGASARAPAPAMRLPDGEEPNQRYHTPAQYHSTLSYSILATRCVYYRPRALWLHWGSPSWIFFRRQQNVSYSVMVHTGTFIESQKPGHSVERAFVVRTVVG